VTERTGREKRRLRTHREILAAARRLLSERGIKGLSLRAVARDADYSPAALYEYFADKEAILDALREEVGASLAARLREHARNDVPLMARFVELGTAYVGFALESPNDFNLLFMESLSQRRSTRERRGGSDAYAVLAAAVESALVAKGVEGGKRVDEIAYGVWSLVHGMATLRLTHLKGFDADFGAAERSAIEALVRGYFRQIDAAGDGQ
jgi:AcrR family transcriptional regulator